jgi:regulator of replication initiation timing
MTETLFQKLEEKMMIILSEVETLRKEIQELHQENAALKFEKENNTHKLQSLISLLDTMNLVDTSLQNTNVQIGKPMLVQG